MTLNRMGSRFWSLVGGSTGVALASFAIGASLVFGVGWAMMIVGLGAMCAIAARRMGMFVVGELHAVRELLAKKPETKGSDR